MYHFKETLVEVGVVIKGEQITEELEVKATLEMFQDLETREQVIIVPKVLQLLIKLRKHQEYPRTEQNW